MAPTVGFLLPTEMQPFDAIVESSLNWSPRGPMTILGGVLACPNYKMPSCCGFFRWFDEEMCSRSNEVIPGLLRKTNKLELLLATEKEKNKLVQDYELLLAAEQEKNKFVQVVLERQANVLEKHSAVMEKHSGVIEVQMNLTAKLQMFKKKEIKDVEDSHCCNGSDHCLSSHVPA
ncbi:hypothetical protein CASFOL_004586 [Castilleja foliolosa]|uniref:Zinc finger GRF-type domain-containing protein n=1 Tax=Castilleja foliolosa TaxID=1961234 RepID=A0ABD3EBL8_9LAMI